MNALLSSQDDSSPDSSPPSSPDSHTLSHHSNLSQHNEHHSLPDLSHSTEGRESQTNQHYHSTKDQSTHTSVNTSTLPNKPQSLHTSQGSNSLPPSDPSDLPYLHPDVLQQQFRSEVSLLPVPRIVGPVPNSSSHSYEGSTLGTALYPRSYWSTTGSDGTLDENMQLADMIAMKYLGNKLAADSSIQHVVRQPLLAPGTVRRYIKSPVVIPHYTAGPQRSH